MRKESIKNVNQDFEEKDDFKKENEKQVIKSKEKQDMISEYHNYLFHIS